MEKWLLRKISGSRSKFKLDGDYSDDRNSKKAVGFENLPQKESIRNKTVTRLIWTQPWLKDGFRVNSGIILMTFIQNF
ncbi:hypothetical protein [Cyclobacterium marinum]|uniref:Uncharacterized protein n=1 Tax=Cyclobacterium marinum (strain ATCC 25205 / DSM 745 / LMG 13164 / NCIMB 1802) TaxID=880070 RepID=G0J5Q6_CYCMS|nr:hypothetical protein [Cyclobacterium marinum]AEL25357.1 hypothetical protein Cycma_1601 [Cyclobacterium marinum DSM 745]